MAKQSNYELFEELGRGENSVVHRAYDLVLGRDVAIKKLTADSGSAPGQSNDQRAKRFLKEAGFLAQFEHENVLRIHAVDQDNGWIIMELMKGTLSSQIAAEPMPADMVRSVLRQMLSALDFLHQKDKVHGAVRPSNILINDQGTVKLSDFEASTRDGELRAPTGSKKYLAPELIKSDFGAFGPAVDLYCLGFTVLELLTGKKFNSLFPGTGEGAIDADVAWLRWHSSDDPMQPVKKIDSSIPDDLATVIDQLLKKPVAERPQSAAEVVKLLDKKPLVPVQVPDAAAPKITQEDVQKILPTKAVKLREGKTRKTKALKPSAKPQSSKDRLNEMLGKPYVLWPICIGILLAALMVGNHLRGDKVLESAPIADKGGETTPIEEPQSQLLDVQFRVIPDANEATFSLDGQQKDLASLKLEPGRYEVTVEKEGFEPFQSAFEIDKDNTTFDIALRELVPVEPVAGKTPEPIEPRFVDVRIIVEPENAALRVAGSDIADGVVRLQPDVVEELKLQASAEGYESRTATWSWEEIAAADYELRINLDKMQQPISVPTIALPDSLIPKPGSAQDQATQLPSRAYVKALQDVAPYEMTLVQAGSYTFGVPSGQLRTWELPAQEVEVLAPFYIGVDEVTHSQFAAFAEATQNAGKIDLSKSDEPVTGVSIKQAAVFCKWVGGRLPQEEEWEAAVRGSDDKGFPLPWGEANLSPEKCRLFRGESDSENGPASTGQLGAGSNQIGMVNTIGNVSEWCDTQHSPTEFIVKGCSFRMPPGDHVRVTWRNAAKWQGANDIGLRLVVPLDEEPEESLALAFVPPTNINEVLQSQPSQSNDEDESTKPRKLVYTKTVQELAAEFTGPAELVIDGAGFMSEIADIQFSPDGKQIAVGGGKVVRIWDIEDQQLVTTLRGDMSRTSYGNVNAVAYSPDGRFLLVGVSDYREHGNIRVYDTGNFEEISELLTGHTAPCRELCFSRDGQLLASADADGIVIVRDWQRREILHRIPARNQDQPILDVMAFPADGPNILTVDFEGPRVLSASTGQPLGARDDMPPRLLGWQVDIYNKLVQFPYGVKAEPRIMDFRMEDGRWAGASSARVDGRSRFWIRVWESREPVSAAKPAVELAAYDKHSWNITALSLQPKGTLVASGDKFGEVHVWDAATGQQMMKFTGQGKPIYEVAFDENTSRLAFGTRPYTPKDWNRNNYGKATQVLDLHQRAIMDAASRDDLTLRNERPQIGQNRVSVRRNDAFYFVEQLSGSKVQSQYRVSSGRNPSVFTLLDEPKLGVQNPVIFGDNEGLLALWDTEGDELKRAFIGHGSLVSAISAASNGKLIATSSTDRTIRLWSLEDYTPTGIFDFKFENSAVREVIPGTSSADAGVQVGDRIVSIDGKSLTDMFDLMLLGEFDYKPGQSVPVTMKRAGQTYDYDMRLSDGYDFVEPILNFYMGDDGQWIIWHPQGYYDASPGADRLIGWHLNRGPDKSARYFEVQQFRKKLYRPDIIDGILETGSLKEALANLDTNYETDDRDFRDEEVIAEYHPPSVQITWPTDGWATEEQTVKVKGEAYSINGLPLTALTLLHNGSVAKVFRPTKVDQIAMLIEHEVKLKPGQNDLVLIAANAKSSSQGKHIVVDLSGAATSRLPRAWVVSIGVSEFEDSLTALPNAAADADAFATAIQSYKNGRLYSDVQTKRLSGSVTDRQILDAFAWLADNTQEGDVAMIYLASHGMIDRRDNFYIAGSNSLEAKARSTAVSWRDLMDTLQLDLPNCQRMVFLDLQPTANAIKPGRRSPLLDLASPEMGTVFLSSNTLQQKPIATGSAANGNFLKAVLETVADRSFDTSPEPGDELFNPVELANGVTSRVKTLTGDRQHPVFFTPEYARFKNLMELKN